MDPILLLVVLLPGIALTVILWLAAGRADRLVEESRNWPSVKGKVTLSRINRRKNGRWPTVHYLYDVRGVRHKGKRLAFVQQNRSLKDCQSIIERYPPDAEVDVWYNPQKPSFSVLQREGDSRALRIAAGITAGIFIIVFIILVISK